MKAFAITVDGFDPMAACADSHGKARATTWRAAQDAGYSTVTWQCIHVRRMPSLDTWAAEQKKARVTGLTQAEWEAKAKRAEKEGA